MYSKLIDVYTFDITETKHTHWIVYVITQTNYWEKRGGNQSTWKYFGEAIQKWSYHTTEGQENLNHIEKGSIGEFTQTVSLKKLSVNYFYFLFPKCPTHFFSHLFRIPEIY